MTLARFFLAACALAVIGSFAPAAVALEFESDDFNGCELDPSRWSVVDPLGDGSVQIVGAGSGDAQLRISVPSGPNHDVWRSGNRSVRVMQAAEDSDFEIEVKFNSLPSELFQIQGLLIEQDRRNFLRVDFLFDGELRLYAAGFTSGVPQVLFNDAIHPVAPIHLRVSRRGDHWLVAHRVEGEGWIRAVRFTKVLRVRRIGPFAGNARPDAPQYGGEASGYGLGSNIDAPAFAAIIDYVAVAGDLLPHEDQGAVAGIDRDGDSVPDCLDGCPDDPLKLEPGSCGCGTPDVDSDSDGVLDCLDGCPGDPNKIEPGACGCGTQDLDTDGDGTPDCLDGCPNDPQKIDPGSCGCGEQDTPGCENESGIVSDDFSSPSLDTDLWSFVNPLDDSSVSISGTGTADAHLLITVPGGTEHEVWVGGNRAPRIMQAANDTDFELEVKFESPLTQAFQNQGLIVEQDTGNYLRFDFFSDGTSVRIFAASFVEGLPIVRMNMPIALEVPQYMRVRREADQWTQRYSTDGETWVDSVSFSDDLAVSSVGVFAGNSGSPAPAHTGVVDYFFNTAFPILPEDPVRQGAPVITGIAIAPGLTSAVVTWMTNQPATSAVRYGESTEYEGGLVEDATLVTLHSVPLTGLVANTSYHCRIETANGQGQMSTSGDLLFSTLDPSGNLPPLPDAGPDQLLIDVDANGSEPVYLDGSGSVDEDGQVIAYVWREGGTVIATGPNPGLTLPFGSHVIQLTVTDEELATASDFVVVTVSPLEPERVETDLQVLYVFDEAAGDTVFDVSGVASPLDLTIADEGSVTWQDDGLRIDSSTILSSTGAATKLIEACSTSNEITIEAWVTPESLEQNGPARIVSLSADSTNRNFTLGQKYFAPPQGGQFEVRLRTTNTNANGLPAVSTFAQTENGRRHVVYTRSASGVVRFYLDGEEVRKVTLTGTSSNWSQTMPLLLANELQGDKPWLGTFHLVGVYSRALTAGEVAQNYDAGTGGPILSGLGVVVGTDSATVTWTTDVPTTSVVAYGSNSTYELGSIEDSELAFDHTIVIGSLDLNAIYHYQIRSADAQGNLTESRDFVFQTFGDGGNGGPVLDIWYGPSQSFGEIGIPQVWANILGNVADLDGVSDLSYRLNGGMPRDLTIGPDTRRLQDEGDFNVDLMFDELSPGVNDVVVTAVDAFGNTSSATVEVNFADGNVWPESYTIDWSTAEKIQDVAQVVDGYWELEENGVRSALPGYDRFILVGDLLWTDYEVTVPITVHSLDPRGYVFPSNQPVVGLGTRWSGHLGSAQPANGYTAFGALGVYYFDGSQTLKLYEHPFDLDDVVTPTPPLALEVTYVWKMRVQTLPGQGQFHALKYWPQGSPEPADWMVSAIDADADAPLSGSLMLLAHHVVATFGDVVVVPVDSAP